MIVEEMHNDLIEDFRYEIVMISRLKLNLSEGEDIPLQRNQFPVQLL